MLVMFSTIFVAETKTFFVCNFEVIYVINTGLSKQFRSEMFRELVENIGCLLSILVWLLFADDILLSNS